jgi:hypothetical protein
MAAGSCSKAQHKGSKPFIAGLKGKKAGTVVLWETMDRVVTAGYTSDDFHDLIDTVESHLAMVFHRLLQGPRAKLNLLINGRAVAPWDPFMSGHPAKPWSSPPSNHATDYGTVTVQCARPAAPRQADGQGSSRTTRGRQAGPRSKASMSTATSGCWSLAAGWASVARSAWNREEAHRLARIRLDIPNTADADWKIDVRKSTARPPVSLRPWLTLLAENTRERARRVFAYRGTPSAREGQRPHRTGVACRAGQGRHAISDRGDASRLSPPSWRARERSALLIKSMLRVIEETVPVQRIWLDTAENKETPRTGFEGEPNAAVVEVAQRALRRPDRAQVPERRRGAQVDGPHRAIPEISSACRKIRELRNDRSRRGREPKPSCLKMSSPLRSGW